MTSIVNASAMFSGSSAPCSSAVRHQFAHELVTAVGHFSARHREALGLRYWPDLGEAEMAEAMTASRGTVKTPVSRGLDALAAGVAGRR